MSKGRAAVVGLQRPNRGPDIDRLRALAGLLLVPFRSALIFCNDGIFRLRSGEDSAFLSYFVGVVSQWHMPLLFVLSGKATCFALRFRKPEEYTRERADRLLVPLVFRTPTIVPPQTYLQRPKEGRFAGSFLELNKNR